MKQRLFSRTFGDSTTVRLALFSIGALICGLEPAALFAAPTITYVQGNYSAPQTPQTTVKVTFTAAQAAGDLNVVAVGWNDSTATVNAVTDASGNVYSRAVGPTVISGVESQSIYYAKNILAAAAGANSVTVTFSAAAAYPDIRILEYRGADPNNPVDVTAASSGKSATSSSGAATTTNATDLIFGANLVQTVTTGAGSGFTKRLLTSPDGDIAEDKMVTATGSYSATAPLSSGQWIMQMVAFRTPAGSFTVSGSPASLNVIQGTQETSTITTAVSGGFSNAISLSASGVPAGTTVSFNPTSIAAPGAGTSTMTITVGSSTAAGTYPITVTGSGGGLQQTATVTLTVTAAPNFTLSASPTSLSVVQGNQGTSTLTTTVVGGFSNAISLTASGMPTGTTLTFNPSSIAAPGAGTSTMTITVGSTTATGTYPITVTATGGGIQHTATVNLTVTTPANFTLSASPTSLSIAQGNQGTSTLTTTVSGGFSNAISLSASGMPTGTTVSFNPSSIAAPGAGTSTMTMTVASTTATGTYPITVTGTGGGLQQTATVTLTVTAAPNFTLSASPTSLSVVQGNQGTSMLTTTVSGGFSNAISLSASGMPTGTSVSFNPSSIAAPGAGTSTVTITVGSSTATGTYPITVTGNGAGIQHTATISLAVTAAPNFTLSASPATVSVVQGAQGASTITTTVSGGFSNSISLSASGMPTGATVSFNPNSIAAPGAGTVTMTITVGSTTAVGTYPITVTGTGGGIQQNGNVTLTVTPQGITAPTNVAVTIGGPGPVVSAVQGYYNSTFLTTHTTAAFDSTGGDLIVMCASSHSGVTLTPSDSFGNTWTPISGPTNASAGAFDLRTQLWYAKSPVVGPGHTITMSLSFSQPLVMSIIVVKGSNIASPIDAVSLIGSDNGTQTTNVLTPSITTTSANDLLIGFVKVSSGVSFQPGANFTQQSAASSNYLDAETGPAATPGNYAASFTISSQENWESAVVAAANDPNQTTLSWAASTEAGGTISNYLVERCQGAGCTNFAQIGIATATSFDDTGLAAATSYSYRVRAEDTANNLGPYSTVVTITTPSPILSTPSAPENLVAAGPIVIAGQSYFSGTPQAAHTTAPFDSTGGDLLVLWATSQAGVTFTPSDSFGNTWTTLAGPTSTSTGSDLRSQLWYAKNPIVGPGQTVTVGLSSAQVLTASIIVAKGSNPSSSIDAASLIGSDNGTQSSNIVSPTVTTTGINDLLLGFAQFSGTAVSLAGAGDTQEAAASSSSLISEAGPAATPGVYDAALTTTSNDTWQSAVVTAANNPNQATLSWAASAEVGGTQIGGAISNYMVERCQGTGCTNFAQIGTTTATTFTDTGLTTPASYSYRVRASDTANSLSPYSSVVTVATTGSLPSAPGNLQAAANRQGPINLTWTASTSNIGIANYLVQRCQGLGCSNFGQIGTSTGTTYTDSAVSGSTTYNYRVQAIDNAGNGSPYSNTAMVTTVGNQPPTAPSNLTATAVSTSQINLSWTASTSSIGLANYLVQRCQGTGCTNFAQISTPTGTTYTDTGLTLGSSYSYQVEAIDIEGNVSPFSNVASATTLSTTTTITYVQGNYATPQTPQTTVTVSFTSAQVAGDLNVVVVGWNDSTATVKTVTDTKGNVYALAVGPTAIASVESQSIYYAKNIAAAAAGANSVTVVFSSAAVYPDIRVLEYAGADPNNPVDVTAAGTGSSATSSSGTVTTTNAADLLFGANIVQTTTSGPGSGYTSRLLTVPDGDIAEDRMVAATGSYSATAPLSSGQWIMQMVAFRTPSGTCSGTPPTAPTNLTASPASMSQINLTWTASTSCPGIADYVVQRCQGANCTSFTQVGTATGTTFDDGGLATNTSYSYQVQAVDNSGNSSSFSNVASATTLAISISPRTAALTVTRTQQFTSTGSGSVVWSVDGAVGGSASSGTITSTGLYTPPNAAGTHTVTVTTSDQLSSASATVYVTNYPGTFTYHNDNLRTGQNPNETVLTTANVNKNQFGKLYSYTLDGIAFASPLYVANVSIPGKGYHNVVYVATENDSVYAFDADGLSTTPLWHVSFLGSGVTTVPCADAGECGDIPTQFGVTSTPVIDQTTGTMYVVAATKEGATTWVQRLHALDITTGAEKFGGPVVLQATVSGTGSGSSGGNVAFDPLRENQRPGLLLNGGVVYIAFGSHGDNSPWHGWVLGYNATTLQQTMKYNATPNGNGGGIWQGGGGLATDTTGDIYFVTSNGDFDANTGGIDYGDTIEKLSPSGSVVDYFTPHDQQNMSNNNLDLGAGGPVLLVDQTTGPVPHLLITAGKSGTIYVINRDNMGKYNASNDNQIVQSLPGVLPNGSAESGNFSTPVFFNGYVYFGAINDTIRAFQLTNGLLSSASTSQSAEVYGARGSSFAISANATSNGILWALQNNGVSADNDVGNPGILYAYDANNLSTELYNSSQAPGNRDTMDNAAKFSIPLVANGKVFVSGQTQLTVFGLLP